MSDITIRLRTWFKAVDAVPAIDLMDEAANEIARLRGDAEVARLRLEAAQGEIARLRPTDEERKAVEWCRDNITAIAHPSSAFAFVHAATLRKLLERLA